MDDKGSLTIRENRHISALEIVISILIGLGSIILCSGLLLCAFLLMGHAPSDQDNKNTLLSVSYQIVFLVIALLSGLSDKNETIYWERFTEYKLVNPKYLNFWGMSCMGFVSLLTETVAYFNSTNTGIALFYGSFLFGIIIIILMSYNMCSIYFNRESFIRKLRGEEYNPFLKPEILTDQLSNLSAFSVIAAENRNSRIVDENTCFFTDMICDDRVNDDVKKKLIETYIDTIVLIVKKTNNSSYIRKLISCLQKMIDENKEKSLDEMVNHFIETTSMALLCDLSDRAAWNQVKECYTHYSDILDGIRLYKQKTLDSIKCNAKDNTNIEVGFDYCWDESEEAPYLDTNRVCNEYQNNAVCAIRFLYGNGFIDELEYIYGILINGCDPIEMKPMIYAKEKAERQGILLTILNICKHDEDMLTHFLRYYMRMIDSGEIDITKEPKKQYVFITRLQTICEKKEGSCGDLIELYDEFMRKNKQFEL